MLYVLLAAIILIGFILIIQRVEFGFALVIVIPIIKEIFQLPEDQIPFLNLLFLFILFTIISFIYHYSFKLNTIKINREHLAIFMIFTSVLLFSLSYTSELLYGADKTLKFMLFNAFFFIAGMVVFQKRNNINRFVNFLKYSIFIIALISTGLLVKNFLSGSLLRQIMVRFSITGTYPMTMARVTGLGLLLWFSSIFNKERASNKLFAIFASINIFIALIATNTRGPLIFAVLIILSFLFLYLDVPATKKLLFTIAIFSVIILFFVLLPKNMFNRYLLLFQQSNVSANNSVFSASSAGRRIIFYNRLLEYLANHPQSLFIGSGAGSFAKLFQDYQICQYPHNIFLEILFEQGLLGLGIFLIALFILIRDIYFKVYKSDKIGNEIIPLIFGLAYYFLNSLVSGDIDNNRLLWLFWGGIIGAVISIEEQNSKNNNFTSEYDFKNNLPE